MNWLGLPEGLLRHRQGSGSRAVFLGGRRCFLLTWTPKTRKTIAYKTSIHGLKCHVLIFLESSREYSSLPQGTTSEPLGINQSRPTARRPSKILET